VLRGVAELPSTCEGVQQLAECTEYTGEEERGGGQTADSWQDGETAAGQGRDRRGNQIFKKKIHHALC